MKKRATSKEMRERLLSAGLTLFQEQGFNATGIQQIANTAKAPKGSFYNYFSSKEEFGAAIIDQYAENLWKYWEHTVSNGPAEPDAAIRNLFEDMVSHHNNSTCYLGCLVGNFSAEVASSSETCRQHLTAVQNEWCQRLAGLIEQAQEQGTVRQDMNATALSSLVWSVWTGGLIRMKSEKTIRPLSENISNILDLLSVPPAEQK